MHSIEVAKSRRKDPNYLQTSADLPKALLLKVRSVCALQEITLAEAIERGLVLWLEELGESVPEFEPPAEFEDGRRTSTDT